MREFVKNGDNYTETYWCSDNGIMCQVAHHLDGHDSSIFTFNYSEYLRTGLQYEAPE